MLHVEGLEQRRLLAIDVAVVDNGTNVNNEGFDAIVAQLNDSTVFDFNAIRVSPSAVDTIGELNAFDAVVIANEGTSATGGDAFATFAPALLQFFNAGGGVVATGWTIFGAQGDAGLAAIDAIVPVNVASNQQTFVGSGSPVFDIFAVHPVTVGVSDFTITGLNHIETPIDPTLDPGAVLLATVNGNVVDVAAAAKDNVLSGGGRSVYLGAIYAGNDTSYDIAALSTGEPDQLLEQAVNWAANVLEPPLVGIYEFEQVTTAANEDPSVAGTVPRLTVRGDFSQLFNAADRTVNFSTTAGGTATEGADYTLAPFIIPQQNFATPTTFDLTITNPPNAGPSFTVINDTIVEQNETANILASDTSLFIAPGDADGSTVIETTDVHTIIDNDTTSVSITATDPNAAEPNDDGLFTVSLTNQISTPLIVIYSVSGTATNGVDYVTLTGSVTIPANTSSATIPVDVIDDLLVEGTETVIVTVITVTGPSESSVTPGNLSATVNIADNELRTVSIAATDPNAAEPDDDGTFTVTISQATGTPTTVAYTVSGTATEGSDYADLSGTVVIQPNQTTATIPVDVINDNLVEGTETVIVTLTSQGTSAGVGIDPNNDEATVNIADDDTGLISVSVVDEDDAMEPADDGRFTIALSNQSSQATTVTYTVSGTATSGQDYVALSGTATIPANTSTTTVLVDVIDDLLVEGTETVVLTLTSVTSGDPQVTLDPDAVDRTATVNIFDNDVRTVSITATDPNAAEVTPPGTPNPGQFTVTLAGGQSGTPTTVFYTVSGTATNGVDYQTLSGSVVIPPNQTTATITVDVIDDQLAEPQESVIVTLTGTNNPGITVGGPSSAQLNISDNDVSVISIAATDPNAAEPNDDGQFTVSVSNVNTGTITVFYTVTGTATDGVDYVSITGGDTVPPFQGSVTIPANTTSVPIPVDVIDDLLVEGTETVIVQLNSASVAGGTIGFGTSTTATVNITDNEVRTVSIAATDPNAAEPNDDGQFTVTLSQPSNTATTVTYTLTGTATEGADYDARPGAGATGTPAAPVGNPPVITGTVVIPANQLSATILVDVIDDTIVEGTETVIATLAPVTSNPGITADPLGATATVNIADNDVSTVSIFASDPNAAEPANDGQFTVSLSQTSATPTTVFYTVGGTATNGVDYAPLSGTVIIPANTANAAIPVDVIDDLLVEGNETVIVTVSGTSNPTFTVSSQFGSATVNIADNDLAAVSVVANDPSAAEPDNDGQFTVTLSQQSAAPTTVTYAVTGTATNGVDYALLTGTVIIPANNSSATIPVDVIDDLLVEPTETVTVTLTTTNNVGNITINPGAASATVNIVDNDAATAFITATDPNAAEPGDDGLFTVTLAQQQATPTTIFYTVSGTATNGVDYAALTGSVIVPANTSSATIPVDVIDDLLVEPTETVIVTLTSTGSPGVTVNPAAASATVNIADNDAVTASIAATDPNAAEPSDPGVFTVTLSQQSATPTVVTYTVSGTATNGVDYELLTGTVTIPANTSSAIIPVEPNDDALAEGNETVIVTLTSTNNPNITVNTGAASATVNIADNEAATASIAATDPNAAEPADDGLFTVTLSQQSTTSTTVNYTVTGTATNGVDYATLSGTVTIPANTSSATIPVDVINDALLEPTETVIVTLTSTTNPGVTVNPAGASAIVNIADDDTAAGATASIVATDPNAAEPADDGLFTVTLSQQSSTATTVTYSVTGTATNGVDYAALSGIVTIPANTSSATIPVDVIDDLLFEPTETVVVTLTGTSNVGITPNPGSASATVNIADNDAGGVSIAATDASASEPADDGLFTVTLSQQQGTPTTVFYTVTGTATNGVDYAVLSGSVVVPANSSTATIPVDVIDDVLVEGNETVIVTITGTNNPGVTVNPAGASATVNIADNEPQPQQEISVTIDNQGKLVIQGTSNDDTVTITGVGTGTGVYEVTTQVGNGPTETETFNGVIDICVFLEAGADSLTMNNIFIRGSIVVEMDSGNDTVTLGFEDVVSTQGDLSIDLGSENDVLTGRRIFIAGDQNLIGGDGDDEMTFEGFAEPEFTLGTSARGNATWNGGNGNDTVSVIYAFIVGTWTIDLGAGTDALDIFGSAASGNVSFLGAAGIDSLTVDTNFFDANLLIDGGADSDTVFLANGLGTDVGTINTGPGNDSVTVENETEGRLNINTGSGNDTVTVNRSVFERFFADLGEGDDELTLFTNRLDIEADLDGGPGFDELFESGNDVRGTVNARNFESEGETT